MEWRVDPELALYLPLYELDGSAFMSREAIGHLVTRTGTMWTPRGHRFDGIDDDLYLDPPAALAGLTRKLTSVVWAKVTAPDSDYKTLFGMADIGAGQRSWYMTGGTSSDNRSAFNVLLSDNGTFDSGHRKRYYTNSSVFDGTPHMYSFTWNAGTLDLQMDAQSRAVTKALDEAITSLHQSTADLEIGCSLNSGVKYRYIACTVGEAWVFGQALTSTELQSLYLDTRWRYQ